MPSPKYGHSLAPHFLFAPGYRNLNHGSFGAVPHPVFSYRSTLLTETETKPDLFYRWKYIELLDHSRRLMADFLNVQDVDEIVFVPNATTGTNTVLRSLNWKRGDVILHFGTVYAACGLTIKFVTDNSLAESVAIELEYPISDEEIIGRFGNVVRELKGKGLNPRVVVFDTITSVPGVRFPWENMVQAARAEGVLSLIDGAHGVGQIAIDLGKTRPDFFVSNCHKWLYTPRGCAVFYVPKQNQHLIESSIPTSHYYIPKSQANAWNPMSNSPSPKSNFVLQFEYNGTIDPTPYLCVPAALQFREEVLGGEDRIMEYCHDLAAKGGEIVAKILGTQVLGLDPTGTDQGRCAMVNVLLPIALENSNINKTKEEFAVVYDKLSRKFVEEDMTFLQLFLHGGRWFVRLSAQVYLEEEDFEWAGWVLRRECERVMRGVYKAKL